MIKIEDKICYAFDEPDQLNDSTELAKLHKDFLRVQFQRETACAFKLSSGSPQDIHSIKLDEINLNDLTKSKQILASDIFISQAGKTEKIPFGTIPKGTLKLSEDASTDSKAKVYSAWIVVHVKGASQFTEARGTSKFLQLEIQGDLSKTPVTLHVSLRASAIHPIDLIVDDKTGLLVQTENFKPQAKAESKTVYAFVTWKNGYNEPSEVELSRVFNFALSKYPDNKLLKSLVPKINGRELVNQEENQKQLARLGVQQLIIYGGVCAGTHLIGDTLTALLSGGVLSGAFLGTALDCGIPVAVGALTIRDWFPNQSAFQVVETIFGGKTEDETLAKMSESGIATTVLRTFYKTSKTTIEEFWKSADEAPYPTEPIGSVRSAAQKYNELNEKIISYRQAKNALADATPIVAQGKPPTAAQLTTYATAQSNLSAAETTLNSAKDVAIAERSKAVSDYLKYRSELEKFAKTPGLKSSEIQNIERLIAQIPDPAAAGGAGVNDVYKAAVQLTNANIPGRVQNATASAGKRGFVPSDPITLGARNSQRFTDAKLVVINNAATDAARAARTAELTRRGRLLDSFGKRFTGAELGKFTGSLASGIAANLVAEQAVKRLFKGWTVSGELDIQCLEQDGTPQAICTLKQNHLYQVTISKVDKKPSWKIQDITNTTQPLVGSNEWVENDNFYRPLGIFTPAETPSAPVTAVK